MPTAALTATPAFAKIKCGEDFVAGQGINVGSLFILAGLSVKVVDSVVERW